MRRSRSLIMLWMLLWCAGVATPAFAEGSAETVRAEASAHFRRGVELFQDEAFRAALVEFERAYEIAPDHRLLYNIGQARFELQDFLGAAQAYEGYLVEGGSEVPPPQREEIENSLTLLRGRVGRISLSINRDGADVFLDDTKIGLSPITSTIPVNVGRHRIAVRAPDGATDTKLVDVTGGEITEVAITLSAVKPQIVEKERMSLNNKIALIGWGAGGALLLGSVVTGVLALSADKDFESLLKKPNVTTKEESDQRDKLKKLAVTTNVMLTTGAVLAVTGTVAWLLGRRGEKRAKTDAATADLQFGVGLGSLSVHGKF